MPGGYGGAVVRPVMASLVKQAPLVLPHERLSGGEAASSRPCRTVPAVPGVLWPLPLTGIAASLSLNGG